PDKHAPDQPRPRRRRDAVAFGDSDPRRVQSPPYDPVEMDHMRPRRQLRHHPATGPEFLDLAAYDVGNDLPGPVHAPPHHGGGGFIATGFDSQDERLAIHCGDLVSGSTVW